MVKQNEGLLTELIPLFTEKMAICVEKGNTELLGEINTILQDLMDNGKIDELLYNY